MSNPVPGFDWHNYWQGIKWLPQMKGWLNFLANRRYQVRTRMGLFDCADRHSITQLYPFYEPEFTAFLQTHYLPGDLFVDVGANIGAHSVRASLKGMEVIALEPTWNVFDCLRTNLKRMNVHGKAIKAAAWSSNGTAILHSTIDSESNTVYEKDISGNKARPLYPIATITLDKLLGGRVPTIIKMDAEGAEPEVIKGARETLSKKHTAIMFEGFQISKVLECTSLLTDLGYTVKKVSGWNYVASPI